MSPNADTIKLMQEELEASGTAELLLQGAAVGATAGATAGAIAASKRSSSSSGTAAAATAQQQLKRSHPPAATATLSSTSARFPGDAPPANLLGLDADPNARLEALYPTHNRYMRQQLPDVKAKSSSSPFAKLLLPSRSGRVTASTSMPQPSQKLEDGFLADAINRWAHACMHGAL